MIFRLLTVVVFIAAVYPVALCLHVGIDWLWGEAEFMHLWSQDSKRRLLQQLFGDWVAAGLWSTGAFSLAAAIGYGVKRMTRRPALAWLALPGSAIVVALLGPPTMITLLYAVACIFYALWSVWLHWSDS